MVEVLVAMTLAAIAIIGIMMLYMAQTRAGGFSRHSTEASVLAQDKIESLRTNPAASLSSTLPVGSPPGLENNLNERALPGGIFTRKTDVTIGASTATVKVEVDWTDDGFSHQVIVYTQRDLP